ncbi:MAG TPA: hypothetical protein VK469_22135 [Candidatus Kapabacteria bacterium]|nr:hypothetical protein [Candidatus Kapabacteria bacterium]
MNKKITSIIMLFVFICFTFSCYSQKKINLVKDKSWDRSSKILTVFTKSGDLFEFSDKKPAVIRYDEIVGEAVDKTGSKKTVSIPLQEAKVIWIYAASNKYLLLPLAIFGGWCSHREIRYIFSE